MKSLVSAALYLSATHALAHPGHSRPGWLHFHEFSDGLLIVIGLIALGLLCWAWKK